GSQRERGRVWGLVANTHQPRSPGLSLTILRISSAAHLSAAWGWSLRSFWPRLLQMLPAEIWRASGLGPKSSPVRVAISAALMPALMSSIASGGTIVASLGSLATETRVGTWPKSMVWKTRMWTGGAEGESRDS